MTAAPQPGPMAHRQWRKAYGAAYAGVVVASVVAAGTSELDKISWGAHSDTFDAYFLPVLLTLPASLVTGSLIASTQPPGESEVVARGLLLLLGGLAQASLLLWAGRGSGPLIRAPSILGTLAACALVIAASLWVNLLSPPGTGALRDCGAPPGSPVAVLADHQVDTAAPPGARRVKGEVHCDESGDSADSSIVYAYPGNWSAARSFYEEAARRQGWFVTRPNDDLCLLRNVGDQAAVSRISPSEPPPSGSGIFLDGETLVVQRGEGPLYCRE